MKRPFGVVLLLLGLAASGAFGAEYFMPYFPSASNPTQQGFVRLVNHAEEGGTVSVVATDDQGVAHAPVTIALGAWESQNFNSNDLEQGNAAKGLSHGIGPGTGAWRLMIDSEDLCCLEALGYIRTRDGFLTAMHDTVRTSNVYHMIPTFNPASNRNQVSKLRVMNVADTEANITIRGVDDDGVESRPVTMVLGASQSRTITAQQLEVGDVDLTGELGDGRGKWQLYLQADVNVATVSLMETPTGHVTNLSTTRAQRYYTPPSHADRRIGGSGEFVVRLPVTPDGGFTFGPGGLFYFVDRNQFGAYMWAYALAPDGTRVPESDRRLLVVREFGKNVAGFAYVRDRNRFYVAMGNGGRLNGPKVFAYDGTTGARDPRSDIDVDFDNEIDTGPSLGDISYGSDGLLYVIRSFFDESDEVAGAHVEAFTLEGARVPSADLRYPQRADPGGFSDGEDYIALGLAEHGGVIYGASSDYGATSDVGLSRVYVHDTRRGPAREGFDVRPSWVYGMTYVDGHLFILGRSPRGNEVVVYVYTTEGQRVTP